MATRTFNTAPRLRGMTLVELMLALSIMAILSLASYTLIAGTLNTDKYLRSAHTTASEVELAIRRIAFNLRTADAMATPTTTTASSTLTITTQPDPQSTPANTQYTVSYRVSNGQLIENDSRYGTAGSAAADNVLCNNVTSFTVQIQALTTPRVVLVTLNVGGAQSVSRSFKVTCRNL